VRVIAALSGGVDSAVAAARMVDAGHEVTGVHLALSRSSAVGGRERGCCTLDDARDARRAADVLGIPFYVWDLSERFAVDVIDDFVAEYAAGRTPNPCVRCNERIKFSAVVDRALGLGFDVVATGHYARLVAEPGGITLHRAIDADKDQAYVLGVLTARQLAHAAFPLGASLKDDVREEAARRGLAVASKPDSTDLCFVSDGDTRAFLGTRIAVRPGAVVDAVSGAVVGRHSGVHGYTIGQRRGLDLSRPAADGSPRYVVDVDVSSATVVVGPAEMLDVDVVHGIRPTWTGAPLEALPTTVTAQFRAHGEPIPGVAWVEGAELAVNLERPIRGLAAGQAVVLFDGTRVIGSATVDRTGRRAVLAGAAR
jgi:tRNA-specific 2-thiouridylase